MENFNKANSLSSKIDFTSFTNYQEYFDYLHKYYEEEFRDIELQMSEGGTTIPSRYLEHIKILKDKIDTALWQACDALRFYKDSIEKNETLVVFLRINHRLYFDYLNIMIGDVRSNIGEVLEENSKKLEVNQLELSQID